MSDHLDEALKLYTPPFRFDHGYIWDSKNNMVADSGDANDMACRVRGWGRISYMENPEQLQDSVGEHMAKALTEYWERNPTRPAEG